MINKMKKYNKLLWITYVVVMMTLLFIFSSCSNVKQTQIDNVTEDISEVTFDVEYHRGGRNDRPENTMYSYLFAIEDGATTIECDMQMLNDGTIVLSHDPFLESYLARDKNGNYVSDDSALDMRTMSLEELQTYDVAKIDENSKYYQDHGKTQKVPEHAQIPTIDDLFSLVKEYGNGIRVNIEIKIYHDVSSEPRACIETDDKVFVEKFNEKVLEYGLEDQIIVQSFDWQSLVTMKEVNPNIKVSALWSEQPKWGRTDEYLRPYEEGASPYLAGLDIDDFEGNAVKAAASLGFDIVSPYCRELTIDMVNEAHELKMEVIPWNANSKEEIEAMYAMGVDGIITDNGPLLRQIILEHGETLFKQRQLNDSPYHLD